MLGREGFQGNKFKIIEEEEAKVMDVLIGNITVRGEIGKMKFQYVDER